MSQFCDQGSTGSILRTTLSPMAMGKRQRRARQVSMWVAIQDLPRGAAHPFYARLNIDATTLEANAVCLSVRLRNEEPHVASTWKSPAHNSVLKSTDAKILSPSLQVF